jgi:hypothetical protein
MVSLIKIKNFGIFFPGKKGWLRIVEAFIAIMLIMAVMLIIIQKQKVGNENLEELKIKERNILNLVARDEILRNEILSWSAQGTNEKVKPLVPRGYNYSINLCKYDSICSLNFTVPSSVISDETLIVANLTQYDPNEAVKLKIFFWKGAYPEGYYPRDYSIPFNS